MRICSCILELKTSLVRDAALRQNGEVDYDCWQRNFGGRSIPPCIYRMNGIDIEWTHVDIHDLGGSSAQFLSGNGKVPAACRGL